MAFSSIDSVRSKFVDSLARPGGNITNVAMVAEEITGKRLAVLKDILPRGSRIAVLTQANHSASTGQVEAAREAAKSLGIQLDVVEVRDGRDYETTFAAVTKRARGLSLFPIQLSSPINSSSLRWRRSTTYQFFANGAKWRRPRRSPCSGGAVGRMPPCMLSDSRSMLRAYFDTTVYRTSPPHGPG